MILVKIRCRRCRSVLAEIRERPLDWNGVYTFLACGKCERPDPSRIVDVLIRKNIDSMQVCREIVWEDMRAQVEAAIRTGKPTDVIT